LRSYGSVVSYKQIAKSSAPESVSRSRNGNHNNPIAIIGALSSGHSRKQCLGGYGAGLSAKQYLLDLERRNINN
jgi:O6-methylguanine-DNA--protein-cysteine methyltransferase